MMMDLLVKFITVFATGFVYGLGAIAAFAVVLHFTCLDFPGDDYEDL